MHTPSVEPDSPDSSQETADSVLVVDDTLIDAALACALIEQREGTRVVSVSNGEAALQAIAEECPDLVVTDLQMPGMNGLELVQEIHQRCSWLPTILMTAHGSEQIAAEALQRGAASYVTKRDLAGRLRETVDDVLAIAGTGRRQQRIRACWTATKFSFCLDNEISLIRDAVGHLQEYASGMLRLGNSITTRVGVALHEALTNAILHGNLELDSALREDGSDTFYQLARQRQNESPYRDRRVHVTATETAGEGRYVIRDEGNGFDVEAFQHDPTDTHNLTKASGRGLFLIYAFMDEVHFNSAGNEITMIHRRQSTLTSSGGTR